MAIEKDRQAPGQPQQGSGTSDKGQMGNKPQGGQSDPRKVGQDQGKVGQDTDGDGKTVKPGQKPGQSHGTGHIEK